MKWDLDESIPILYIGQGTGGHAFICDGYNYSNYFHFNWGWSGQGQGTNNDAYYYINNLNPNSYNYSDYQAAVFGICPPSYYISASASPSEGGSVTGSGYYYSNKSCSLHAIANAGYTFVNWTENGTVISSNPYYTFMVNSDRYLKANFKRNNYTVSVSANPTEGGTVTGGNTFNYGQNCTVKATAKSGFVFVNWTENGTQVSTNADYSFSVSNNRNLVANFQRTNYTIRLLAHPTTGGSVSGAGTYNPNHICTVNAIANSGYIFSNWTENETIVSNNATYSFTITSNRDLIAHFKRNTHTITTLVGSNGSISPSGSITINHGEDKTFTMIPDQGYAVQEIYVDGSAVGASTTYTFTNVTENHRIYVIFKNGTGLNENAETITVYPNPTEGSINLVCPNTEEIRIYNTLGVMVRQKSIGDIDNIQIDMSGLPNGIYFLQAIRGNGTITKRIIKAE